MTEIDTQFRAALEHQVPLRLERHSNWTDVMGRAQAQRHPRRAKGLFVAGALAFALVIVASALAATGHNVFGTIGSWLNGTPGQPASKSEQTGFDVRNNASYASFPSGTKVRRLTQTSAAGKTFTLLGFKSNQSLCLRLVRTNSTASRGTNQCVTLHELDASPAPVLVASEARFRTASDYLNGIFGFADDTVRSIEYRRGRGPWKSAGVESNVFVALDARRSGTVRNPSLLPPIVQVRAVTKSGKRVAVPFVASDEASYPNGLPTGPSYLTHGNTRPQDLPGATRVEHPFTTGTIGWLLNHEARGKAWQPPQDLLMRLGTVAYARAVQPDPANPARVGLFLVRSVPSRFLPRLKPGTLVLCETTIRPLNGPSGGVGCNTFAAHDSLFNAGQPFTSSFTGPSQLTELSGVVADGIVSMKLFLASGRVVPVALRYSAYSVSGPTAQFPAKLVAYDAAGRVVGLQVLGGPARALSCPSLSVWSTNRLPATKPYQRLDLATLTVAGAPIFGRSPAQVEAVLGKPDRVQTSSVDNGHREPTLFYGGVLPGSALLVVAFHWDQHRSRATSMSFQGRGLVDARLGHLLNIPPQTLQRLLGSSYPAFHLTAAYGSVPGAIGVPNAGGCSGQFRVETGVLQLSFGLNPYQGARPFLTLTHPY
jgi:hypothetical protein